MHTWGGEEVVVVDDVGPGVASDPVHLDAAKFDLTRPDVKALGAAAGGLDADGDRGPTAEGVADGEDGVGRVGTGLQRRRFYWCQAQVGWLLGGDWV